MYFISKHLNITVNEANVGLSLGEFSHLIAGVSMQLLSSMVFIARLVSQTGQTCCWNSASLLWSQTCVDSITAHWQISTCIHKFNSGKVDLFANLFYFELQIQINYSYKFLNALQWINRYKNLHKFCLISHAKRYWM